MSERIGSTVIENVRPQLDAGRWAVKRVEGETLKVKADIFKEGHDVLVAVVRWRQSAPQEQATEWAEEPMVARGNDLWEADLPLTRNGRYEYTVEAWPDLFATWVSELKRKVDVGRDVRSELLEGAALLKAHAERAQKAGGPEEARRLSEAAAAFGQGMSHQTIAAAMDPGLALVAAKYADRTIATRYDRVLEVFVDRERASYGSWYEFFPRSAVRDGRTHGTFRDAERWLPYVQSMGFDVIYLPPIHPIGRTARKGKNNSLTAGPEDVGSPWAIGAAEGGHKALNPALGTLEDFRRFVRAANAMGMEIALDLAYQCSPDHPYVKEHPEWFLHRPDGTIKTAENPPKRYEDIVNFDWMGPGRATLWPELKSVVMHWVEQGVRIFRVDNPHTKPLQFWAWLIREVHSRPPGRRLPRGGLHPTQGDEGPGQAGLPAVVHLLHLAQLQAGDGGVPHGDHQPARVRLHARQPLAEHAGHPPRVPPAQRAGRLPAARRHGRHALQRLGHVLRLRAVRGHSRQAGQGGVPRLGEVRAQGVGPGPAGQHPRLHRPAQHRPPRAPRLPALRQPELPPGGERPGAVLPEAHAETAPARCWWR